MPTRMTPDQIADKQIRRCSEEVDTVVAGIEAMTQTPGAAAKKKKEKYRAGILRSLDDGTWDAGHDSYSLPDYKSITTKKVRDRYAQGVADARSKIVNAQTQLASHRAKIQQGLAGMPDDTEQQREARMLYNKREMGKFKMQRSRR